MFIGIKERRVIDLMFTKHEHLPISPQLQLDAKLYTKVLCTLPSVHFNNQLIKKFFFSHWYINDLANDLSSSTKLFADDASLFSVVLM